MAASLQGVLPGSLVHRFITAGKPGYCELCPAFVEKLEAHHISYAPEITIKLCHNCHHKVHFWPVRLNEEERLKLLRKKFIEIDALKISKDKFLGMQALAKIIAPSRSAFIHSQQILEIRRLNKKPEKKPEQDPKLYHNKLFKDQDLKNNKQKHGK